jgi:hypothetical protein
MFIYILNMFTFLIVTICIIQGDFRLFSLLSKRLSLGLRGFNDESW